MNKLLKYPVLVAAALCGCSLLGPVAGTSEQGNAKVIASIYTLGGNPAVGAAVRLRRADYLSDTVTGTKTDTHFIKNTVTGANGSFTIDSLDTSAYSIEVNDGSARAVLFRFVISQAGQTVRLADTLRSYAVIRGTVDIGTTASRRYVQVFGLERLVMLDSNNRYALSDLPAGTFRLRFFSLDTGVNSLVFDSITAGAGQTVQLSYSNWQYSRLLYLNTTASGAGVGGDVLGFPVLVRLTDSNFVFSQTMPDGGDVRFVKPDGTPLPYEIERWEPVTERAEVWVKVDTVYGNDSSHCFIMYWGNPSAANESSGPAVFDTADGFQGIWHLGESDSLAPDATGNRYNGTGYFTAPAAGMIGNAQYFNGVSSYIQMTGTAPQSRLNFPMNGRYTVSAWIYHDTLADSVTYVIAGKGEHQYFIKNFGLAQSTPTHVHQWEFTEYHGNDIWHAATFVPAVEKTWTYLVGIRDGSNQYLYVNGALAMQGYQVFGTGQDTIPRDTSDDFSIGAFLHPVTAWNQGYAYFRGAIDEMGVSSVPRSADWVKLCYMNQKEQDALVKW
jgi:hypothetical protein